MRTVKKLLEMFLNDEKLLSRKAPVEALAPEMSDEAIAVLKTAGMVAVGDFQDKSFDQIIRIECAPDLIEEIIDHWYEMQEDQD